MSGKLDQSLDEILSTQRSSATRGKGRRGRRVTQAGRSTAVAAPVGGVKKTLKQAKSAMKVVPTGPSGGRGDSKIQVSNLVSMACFRSPQTLLTLLSPKMWTKARLRYVIDEASKPLDFRRNLPRTSYTSRQMIVDHRVASSLSVYTGGPHHRRLLPPLLLA